MYKFLFAIAIGICSFTVNAQHRQYHHYHHHRHTNNNHWIAPVIIGGIVGYAIANSSRVEATPNVVYIEQTPMCPYGTMPLYARKYLLDHWGRYVPYNQFIGCQ